MRLRSLTALALVLALSVITTAQTTVGRLGASLPKGVPAAGGGGGGVGTCSATTVSNFVYQGSFRLPAGLGGSANGFQYAAFGGGHGGGGIAYYSAGNGGKGSLYVGGSGLDYRGASVAEISIPGTGTGTCAAGGACDLVLGDHPNGGSTNVTALPTANFLHNFADISGGLMAVDPLANNVSVAELLIYGGQLYAAGRLDFNTTDGHVSHIRHGLDLSVNDASGWHTVRDLNLWNGWVDVAASPARAVGMIAGPMGDVPFALQSSLGGPVIAGLWGLSLVSRTSQGAAAFTFDPAQMTDTPSSDSHFASSSPVTATGLLYYPTPEHATLGPWDDTSIGFNGRQDPSTRPYVSWNDYPAALIIENNCLLIPEITGAGQANLGSGVVITGYYGPNTEDPTINGRPTYDDGAPNFSTGPPCANAGTPPGNCTRDQNEFYPFSHNGTPYSGHGPQSWPYFYRVQQYEIADLQAVKAGTKKPWEITPAGQFTLPVAFDIPGGTPYYYPPGSLHATYDRGHRLVYILQPGSVDQLGAYFPLLHVFSITAAP